MNISPCSCGNRKISIESSYGENRISCDKCGRVFYWHIDKPIDELVELWNQQMKYYRNNLKESVKNFWKHIKCNFFGMKFCINTPRNFYIYMRHRCIFLRFCILGYWITLSFFKPFFFLRKDEMGKFFYLDEIFGFVFCSPDKECESCDLENNR